MLFRSTHGGRDPLTDLRDGLLDRLLALPGVELTGPDPRLRSVVDGDPCRLPHHISLLVRGPDGRCLPGRQLVRQLWREGVAVGSGSACSSGAAGATSPVLKAMGYSDDEAAGGLRLSLGPWLKANDLEMVPERLQRARAALALVSGP